MDKEKILAGREFMKDYARAKVDWEQTDQAKGVEVPPTEVRMPKGLTRYFLEPFEELGDVFENMDIRRVIEERRTRRKYTGDKLSFGQLSGLLWASAGYRQPVKKKLRHVPSAGNRQPIEVYAIVMDSDDIPPGVYRYVPSQHALDLISDNADGLRDRAIAATRGQVWAGTAGVTFAFAAVPYRTEWRFDYTAHRVILMDVGHMCQNLYLAATSMGLGACAMAAYDQDLADHLIGVDGEEQFTVYMCSVGVIAEEE